MSNFTSSAVDFYLLRPNASLKLDIDVKCISDFFKGSLSMGVAIITEVFIYCVDRDCLLQVADIQIVLQV